MGMAKMAMKNATEDNDNHTLRFNWTVGTESALDSSFFWGYLLTQVPGGFVASLYPANKIFGAAIAISSFLNLLVPGALKVDPIVDMIVQVIKGLVEVREIYSSPLPLFNILTIRVTKNNPFFHFRVSRIQLATVFGNIGRHRWRDLVWQRWHFAVLTLPW